MKILVFSDSHGELRYMIQAIREERPNRVFHLGDVTRDAVKLAREFPELPIEQVRGNCDSTEDPSPEEKEVLVEGRRLWLLHGHTYQVKLGTGLLVGEARNRGVDAVFFGHTHQSYCGLDGGVWAVNPGTVRGWPGATCAVVEIGDGRMDCRIKVLR